MRRLAGVVAVLLAVAAPLAAQDSATVPWRTSRFPYLTISPNDGVMPFYRLVHFRQAAYDDRVSLRDALAVEAGYSTRRSRVIRGRGDFPRLAEGTRLEVDGEAGVTPRFGNPDAHWQERRHASLNAEVTRRLGGPLHLAARAGLQWLTHRMACSDGTAIYPDAEGLGECFAFPGPDDGTPSWSVRQRDARGRLALVLDLRDREFETRHGVLLEAGAFAGSANDGYRGAYGMARGWLAPREGTRMTARFGFRALSQNGAIGIQHELPLWENPAIVLGGPRSQRGLGIGEVAGRGLLLGGAEVRQDLLAFRNIAALSVFAFADGGRAFRDPSPLVDPVPGAPVPTGALSFTLDGWDWSYGGGIAVRVLRAAQLNVTAAHHPAGGTTWYLSSGWSW